MSIADGRTLNPKIRVQVPAGEPDFDKLDSDDDLLSSRINNREKVIANAVGEPAMQKAIDNRQRKGSVPVEYVAWNHVRAKRKTPNDPLWW